jgi:cysteine desulfurase/selenocysteine lyase
MSDIKTIQQDFPILAKKIGGNNLVYFDNGATSQKPKAVLWAEKEYYEKFNANVHRGIHLLAEEATQQYEHTRAKTAEFIGAASEKEIIFIRNTTEATNLVAYAWGRMNISSGDEIVTTVMEHHSNFLPWRQLALENNAVLKVADIDDRGRLMDLAKAVTKKTKLVAIAHVSNVLGTINPIKEIIKSVRSRFPNIVFVVDGAQAVPHFSVDAVDLDVDFYAFSPHKAFGPMGIGVLYGKQKILEQMPPFLFGGGMITSVTLKNVEFADLPDKFEAGTPNVAGAVGLAAAIDYLKKISYEQIGKQEAGIMKMMLEKIKKFPEITLYGPPTVEGRVPTFSFSIQGVHPHDAAQFLNDRHGIAVRAGQHCTGPLHEYLGVPATIRASLAFYNTEEEVNIFIKAVKDLIETFS